MSAPFAGRGLGWLVGLVGLSFAGGLVLMALSDRFERVSVGPGADSVSALGHGLLVALIEESGRRVVVSRAHTEEKLGRAAALVVAEPRLKADEEARIASLGRLVELAEGGVLLVLPKREGLASREKERWIAWESRVDSEAAEALFEAIGAGVEVTRTGRRVEDLVETANAFVGERPRLDDVQLLRSPDVEPLIAYEEGVLLGRLPRFGDLGELLVLSDPDLVANHGLDDGDNARLVLRILRRVAVGGGPIVIDETFHDLAGPETVWEELFTFPLLLATLQGLAVLALLAWAAAGRFGRPDPLPLPPSREPGKRYLIENTARLLHMGGHEGHALRAYRDARVREVSRALRLPPNLDADERRAFLDRVGRSRGASDELGALDRELAALGRGKARENRTVALARRYHRWKKETLHGSRDDSRHR